MTIRAILQARCSSSRLPRKVLADVCGRPMLMRQLERIGRARTLNEVVVATSTDPSDDELAAAVEGEGVALHRGSLDDVLQRFVGATGTAEHLVRLTGDCPLADWEVIDAAVELHLESGADYTSNALRRTYPVGLDVEVIGRSALLAADAEATSKSDREHVTPFLYHHPGRFRLVNLAQEQELGTLRWTVDEPADLEFVRAVYGELWSARPDFRTPEILALLARRPELARINSGAGRQAGERGSLAPPRR